MATSRQQSGNAGSSTSEAAPLVQHVTDVTITYGTEEELTREWLERQSPLATESSFEAVQSPSENGDTLHIFQSAQPEDTPSIEVPAATATARDGAVAQLTRRLRCLFSAITWPIVPLGTVVSVALLWLLYAAFVLDLKRTCSHPLHWYAFASLAFVTYAPHHAQARSYLFRYSRERDGPVRPPGVRMYDQLFHTLCILYVYGGVTLVQTCRESEGQSMPDAFDHPADGTTQTEGTGNVCAATCPHLYQALAVYVTTLELFTFALILPLLFLPCIYLWILRRATAEADAFAEWQERFEEEEALLTNGGVTEQELMDSLERVKLVTKPKLGTNPTVMLMPALEDAASWVQDGTNVKECCICMSEFVVIHQADLESGLSYQNPADQAASPSGTLSLDDSTINTEQNAMVRTKCGHVFHKKCLAGWIGGRWEPSPQNDSNNDGRFDRRRRRARRTCCPLCREDLKPATTTIP